MGSCWASTPRLGSSTSTPTSTPLFQPVRATVVPHSPPPGWPMTKHHGLGRPPAHLCIQSLLSQPPANLSSRKNTHAQTPSALFEACLVLARQPLRQFYCEYSICQEDWPLFRDPKNIFSRQGGQPTSTFDPGEPGERTPCPASNTKQLSFWGSKLTRASLLVASIYTMVVMASNANSFLIQVLLFHVGPFSSARNGRTKEAELPLAGSPVECLSRISTRRDPGSDIGSVTGR